MPENLARRPDTPRRVGCALTDDSQNDSYLRCRLHLGSIVDGTGAAAGIIVYDAEGTASDFTVAGSPRASTDQYLSARHLLLLERADGFVLVETDLTDDEDGIAGITPLTIPAAIAAKDPLFFSLFVGEGNFFRLIA